MRDVRDCRGGLTLNRCGTVTDIRKARGNLRKPLQEIPIWSQFPAVDFELIRRRWLPQSGACNVSPNFMTRDARQSPESGFSDTF